MAVGRHHWTSLLQANPFNSPRWPRDPTSPRQRTVRSASNGKTPQASTTTESIRIALNAVPSDVQRVMIAVSLDRARFADSKT
jgi:stress response protein SCP2